MPLSTLRKSQIRCLAKGGDAIAQAISDQGAGISYAVGAEAANVRKAVFQFPRSVGNVLVTAVGGTITLADGGAGSLVTGGWFKPDSTGKLEVDIGDAAAQEILVKVETDVGGQVMFTTTFA